MFRDSIEVNLIGNRLHINYFEGAVIIEEMNKRRSYEYLQEQSRVLGELRSKLLIEAAKFEEQE